MILLLSGEYADTLEHLDISGCTGVDWNGFEVLWRLRNLKTLVVKDMSHIKDLDLLCLLLLEVCTVHCAVVLVC